MMNKYAGLSDFEINKKVADELGFQSEIRENGTWIFNKIWIPFDPCNNVEQAWEIMMDNEISVTPNGDGMYISFRVTSLFEGIINYYEDKVIIHKKPLVAAMLCFLEL